jgi:type II secretory pathway pseudopilin PulG
LIELLVVVSIIALLISILLPAVGQTRRQARISLCTSNMKQHGVGVGNYASQNNDTLPHAPLSTGRFPQEGPRGSTAWTFAHRSFPLNGFGFQSGAVTLETSPIDAATVFNFGDFWPNLQGWNGYFVFLSEFMVDGEGAQAMNDVFLSPSDLKGKRWWPYVKSYMRSQNGVWWNLNSPPGGERFGIGSPTSNNFATLGSYRYSFAAMSNARAYSFDRNGVVPAGQQHVLTMGNTIGPGLRTTFVKRNPQSEVDYPSNKVLFWMWYAWHNPLEDDGYPGLYMADGKVSTIALADGSARAVRAYQDAIGFVPVGPQRFENAGTFMALRLIRTNEVWGAPFWMTIGGIKGRDIQ